MRDEKGFLTMLGFAAKARKLVSGEKGVESFLKQNDKVKLLILANDMPQSRKDFWRGKAEILKIDTIEAADKMTLGIAIGTSPRGVIGILDDQMKKAVLERF